MPLVDEFLNTYIAAWNAHDIQSVAAHYTSDYEEIDVAHVEPIYGPDAVGSKVTNYLRAFPDLQFALDDWIADDERVAVYWTWTGRHLGTFMNIPATGHNVKVRGASLVTLENGKIRRALRIWDLAGLLRDLHLLPELVS